MGLFSVFGGNFDAKIKEARAEKNAIIIDVREPREYASGHVPGATNVPLKQVGAYATGKETPLYVYCQSGARSSQAKSILGKNGFTQVTNLGGIASYRGPLEK